MTNPLPWHRLVRGTDPDTSLESALKATKASKKAVAVATAIMSDGLGRTDEELWWACRAAGYISSRDTIEHARLALEEAGMVVETGERRLTSNGMPSRVWVLVTGLALVRHPMLATLTREVVHVHMTADKRTIGHDVYEGEARMTQQQQDAYKQIIGDGLAKITVTQELSESNYGNGGKVMVAVTLTCDQSQDGIAAAIGWAKNMADTKAWEHMGYLKQQLVQRGILTP